MSTVDTKLKSIIRALMVTISTSSVAFVMFAIALAPVDISLWFLILTIIFDITFACVAYSTYITWMAKHNNWDVLKKCNNPDTYLAVAYIYLLIGTLAAGCLLEIANTTSNQIIQWFSIILMTTGFWYFLAIGDRIYIQTHGIEKARRRRGKKSTIKERDIRRLVKQRELEKINHHRNHQ